MKHTILIFSMLCIFPFSNDMQIMAQNSRTAIQFQKQDKDIVDKILTKLKGDNQLATGLLVVKVGQQFLDTPYVANTLEVGGDEGLVVNLRQLDCTTFAENCLALARTIQKENPTFDGFVDELRYIRYRDGILNAYPSRLHYFGDWIYNNDKKKTIQSISKEMGSFAFSNRVNFMSNHPDKYPALVSHPEFVKTMAGYEVEISNRKAWYIPKNKLHEYEHLLHEGDIIGITTDIKGMDMSHVIIAIAKNGRIHLLHASLKHKKVLVSTETLEDYLNNSKLSTGIVVARPL